MTLVRMIALPVGEDSLTLTLPLRRSPVATTRGTPTQYRSATGNPSSHSSETLREQHWLPPGDAPASLTLR
ncbi:MAG: hypothetical protein PUP91_39360 [Rhizonema sp. PD37]|nr:hypothetical protein [Rhizonema sp. PD37]